MSKQLFFISFLVLGFSFRSFSQIIVAPDIQCIENNAGNQTITLDWINPPNNPCGAFIDDTIYASSNGPNGPYDSVYVVTSQAATSYVINTLPVGATWYFYMVSNYNCPGATVLSSDTINNLAPAVPVIVDVTVLPNNKVVVNWADDPSPQTAGYIVYYYLQNGIAVLSDTLQGRTVTTWTDPTGDPSQQSLFYTVSAFDSCGNKSAFRVPAQNTIFTTAGNTECQRQVNITWSKYNNWPQGGPEYQVWISTNEGPYVMVGITDTSHLLYEFTNFNNGDSLAIFIQALSAADTNVTSDGNYVYMKAEIVQPPAFINITNITVTLANDILVTWIIDTTAQLIFYEVLRCTDSLSYIPETEIPATNPLHQFQTYTDSDNVYPQNNPYYYEIDAFDSCQNQYVSPFGESVWLNGTLWDYYVAKLNWNSFQLANTTVLRYNLYRDIGNGAGFQLIRSFAPNVNLDYDSLQQFLSAAGTFCYRIEAVYFINLPAPANYQDTLSSFSNEVCVIHQPVIYIPNAFAPGGNVAENQVFMPTIIYGNPQNYSLTIFNRWGAEIFVSNSVSIGWNGDDHGKEAEMGGYAYLIKFTADDGTQIVEKGMVLLVR